MKNKSLVGIVGSTAIVLSACKPAQEAHRENVDRILACVEPTADVFNKSVDYYDSRGDLRHLKDSGKISSLVFSHAKLSMLAEQLKTGGITLQDFLTVLQSKDRIITDENTKLKISTNFGRDVYHLYSHGDELELWTESHSPNRILRNFSTEVKIEGGELKVSFSGTEFETKARENKEQLSASADVIEKGSATYTISGGLVLAK